MEWCRMSTLGFVICVVLLWCELTGCSDIGHMSGRNRKIMELLKTLNMYPAELQTAFPPINSSATIVNSPTVPSKHFERPGTGFDTRPQNFVPESSPFKSYEDYSRTMYGTQEGISYLRKQFGPTGLQEARAKFGVNKNFQELKLTNDHVVKMVKRGKCEVPVPQVVRVKHYYPDPSREYMPKCTLLHRCGDMTGCCDSEAFQCVPSAAQEVTLHFYVLKMDRNGLSERSKVTLEKLLFVNHTACECQEVNNLPRIQNGPSDPLDGHETPAKSKCRECPVPFNSRVYKDGRCGCDCFDRQKPCLRIKRGKAPLSDIERRCVEANQCHIPDCEYGLYDFSTGFCPKRHDEGHRSPSRRHHFSPSHRWAFLERD